MKQPAETMPVTIWRTPLVTIAPASASTVMPKVIQKAAQGDMPETANTIPTRISTTPAPPSPISLNILFINSRISHRNLNVNHNFDTRVGNIYPLAKRLEGRASGNIDNEVNARNGI
jgi:hypothetical protein